jgi:hypothetical protein
MCVWDMSQTAEERAKMLSAENDELMDTNAQLRRQNTELHEGLFMLRDQIDLMQREGGLVVHALDRALQLAEQLYIFLPPGTVMPDAVATCKYALDDAMHAIGQKRANIGREPWNSGNTPAFASPTPTPSATSSTPSAAPAGSSSPSSPPAPKASAPPPSPSASDPSQQQSPLQAELGELSELQRLGNALFIAGQNIVKLTEQRDKVTATLNAALVLVQAMMTNLRVRGVEPDPIVVTRKAQLDQTMRVLLGEDADDQSQPIPQISALKTH